MITIQCIKVDGINISKDNDGNEKIEGHYQLISSNDKVLARQGFNGYSDIKVNFSTDTLSALNAFLTGVKKDISITVLGE